MRKDFKDIMPYVPDLDLVERAQKILEATIESVSGEAKEKGGFYNILSEDQRDVVDHLVFTNFEYYRKHIRVDLDTFKEKMAQNYLVKSRVFGQIVELAGYSKLDNVSQKPDTETEFACLSRNASYAMLGKGVYQGSGGSLLYTRLPLREGDPSAQDLHFGKRARLEDIPSSGEPLLVWYPGGRLCTSPVVEVYTRNEHSGETIDAVSHTITHTYRGIDSRTLGSVKMR